MMGSRPVVGSSNTMISGSGTLARAKATPRTSPPPLEEHPESATNLVKLLPGETGDVHTVDQDLSAFRPDEPDHVLEHHTLTRPAQADDRGDPLAGNVEVHPVQHLFPVEGLLDRSEEH